LEREWNEAQKNKKKFGELEDFTVHTDSEEEDDLPFACAICREDFVEPIRTKCGHYFCERCALHRARKTPKCAVCDENTHGIFNSAPKLLAKLREKQKKAKEDEAKGNGNDGDVGEEG
jgi:RING finger protein 113A